MRFTRSAVLPIVSSIVVALVAAGCSSESGGLSDDEQQFADAWASTIEDDEHGFGAEPDDAACMGDAIMAELGAGPFEDAGVSPDDIGDSDDTDSPGKVLGGGVVSDDQTDAILDTWEECVDLPALLAAASASDFDLDEDAEACVADGLAEDDLGRELLRPSFTEDDDTPEEDLLVGFVDLVDTCGGGADGSGADGGGVLVDEIAASLVGGEISEDEARCLAEAVIDDVGLARLVEITAGGDFNNAAPEDQQELAQALLAAAGACDVPLSALGG